MSASDIRGCLDHPNPIQLGLIREIHEELAARSIPHWLGGGWALDFLLGEALRVHGDVDWAIWKRDAGTVSACLQVLGYAGKVVRHPEEHTGFHKRGQYVIGRCRNLGPVDGLAVPAGSVLRTTRPAG